jgi:hypothetical protein
MVGKDDLNPELVSGFDQQAGNDANRIEQLDGIERLMNVGLDHRTIDSRLSSLFDFFILGVGQQITRNEFPCLRGQFFDVFIQGRLFEPLAGNADSAKSSQDPGVGDMKSQVFIGEIEKPHHHRSAKHLLGSHPMGTGSAFEDFPLIEVLQYMIASGRSAIKHDADNFQLFFFGMTGWGIDKRHLFLMFFAHFVFGPFLIFVVILNVWRLSTYYNEKRIATTKCAFFIDIDELSCRMDTN